MLAIIRRARARPVVWTLLWGAAPAAGAGDDVIDEVVDTARKVAEPLSSVPLAIQVISRQEIERSGIDGLVSLAGQVTGLYLEPMWGGTNASPTMRGQAHAGDVGAETVGIFIDGILEHNEPRRQA